MRRRLLALLVLMLVSAVPAFAATHYVRDGGTCVSSCTSSWATAGAYDQLTSAEAAAARGDTIYVADGSYNGGTFNTTAAGTTPITIKKATIADHGTETGWLDSYGDGTCGPVDGANCARFTSQLFITTGYWVFDGQVGGGPATTKTGWQNGYGFKVSETSSTPNIFIDDSGNAAISHIEIAGAGDNGSAGGTGNDAMQVWGSGATSLSYAYAHDLGRCVFYHGGSGNPFTVSYVYTGKYESTAGEHSEVSVLRSTALFIFRWGVVTHSEGTGGFINTEGPHTAELYGNIFFGGGDTTWIGGNNGFIASFSDGNLPDPDPTNWKVYNNSFVSVPSDTSCFGDSGSNPTGNVATNNYFYNSTSNGVSSGWTQSYGHFQNSGTTDGTNATTASSGDPFVALATYNFSLSAATTAGTTLGSPYNVDMFGVTRGADGTWDRGAVEFTTGGGGVPGTHGKGKMRMRGKDPVLLAAVGLGFVGWRLSRRKEFL